LEERAAQDLVQAGDAGDEFVAGLDGALTCHQY
jgi:hypothetical protein